MGAKKITKVQIVTNGSMTGTSTITSTVMDLSNLDNVGLQVTYTGTPNGTFAVNGSNDGTNFYALTFSPSLPSASGSASGFLINLNQFPWQYMELQYTNTSSTGTLNVYLFAKDLN